MNELPTNTHKEGDNKGGKRGKQDAEGRHTRGTELSRGTARNERMLGTNWSCCKGTSTSHWGCKIESRARKLE